MIGNYIKDRLRILYLFICFGAIFAAVFYVYNVPMSGVLYGCLLCGILSLTVVAFDFYGYAKRHRRLGEIKQNAMILLDKIQRPEGLLEQDYYEIAKELESSYRSVISQMDTKQTEMMDFYTMWVHQIKTPISAMSMVLQQKEDSAQLQQELFKIERYVELVLGYLRIDSMSSDLQLDTYNLEDMVRSAVKKYAPVFIHNKLVLELRDLNITVLTDEKWLVFVIEQLLSNALKYTDRGKISIYATDDKTLVIEDTGIGISGEDLPRVFEKGFTGYNGRMDKKSTGLGLYLCRRTLDKLHHHVQMESTSGVGTKVMISMASSDTFIE